jgi:hypothetical protein
VFPLVILVPLMAIHYLDGAAAERALAEAVAEADRLDPGWRLEDIEAKRRQIPEEKNGALMVLSAYRMMPKKWFSTTIDSKLTQAPPVRLDEQLTKELRDQLKPLAGAITRARQVVQFPEGRFAITYAPIPLNTPLREPDKSRMVAFLLLLDGRLQIQEGKLEEAWTSIRAILNTGRSVGDEPLPFVQLMPISTSRMAVELLERTLAQGIISEPLLPEMQKALAEEAKEARWLRSLRGERASAYRMFLHWENSGVSWDQLSPNGRGLGFFPRERIGGITTKIKKGNAWTLRFYTQVIENFKKSGVPLHQSVQELRENVTEWDKKFEFWALWVAYLPKFAETYQLSQTELHCACAALASERFRLQKKRWPVSLGELVKADVLKEIPIDPMDGKPLRVRRTVDGLVIYSVGADGKYRGDALDNLANFDPKQARPEFRLWDVSRRGVSK